MKRDVSRRQVLRWLGAVGLSVGATLLAACGTSPTPAAPASGTTGATANGTTSRSNEGGGVTVIADWTSREEPRFSVSLETHSVGLDGVDLAKQAALRVDGGDEVRPISWDAPLGGHHRSGVLTFPAETNGRATVGKDTRTVELIIRGVAGVPERRLLWESR